MKTSVFAIRFRGASFPIETVFKAVLLVGILSADGDQELCGQTPTNAPTPVVIVAEGESFAPQGKDGWEVIPQDRSFASHTYGGMWVSQGGLLSVPARQEGAVAVRKVPVPQAGQYRVWSKYQAPPFFHYLHKIELVQGGKTVFSHVYGKGGTERLWSFSGESDELWWPWGIDHDAAEAPTQLATLAAGEVEIRLIAAKNLEPAGDRCLDFVLLTTNPANDYQGFKPYAVGSPFMNEAFAATKLYLRFKHSLPTASQLTLTRAGHFQPQYGGAKNQVPETAVAPGQWSAWVNIGPFCRLVHNEGITATLPSPGPLVVQVARDPQGGDPVGEITLASGESFVVPVDVTWNREAKVRSSREYAEAIVSQAKTWRTANGGKKAKELLFFGSFLGEERWVHDLKHALGYNTHLPEGYEQSPWRGEHHHVFGPPAIQAYAAKLKDKSQQRFISFGDEISLGQINFNDPKNVEKFRQWLKSRGVTASSLGVSPDQLTLVKDGQSPLAWYSNLFNEEERFAAYRESTEAARAAIGPHVLTGANYSPHHLALCYGPVFQWVDIFRHQGMSMFWAEDYIFSVPEAPQMWSWMLAQARCGVKYHGQPIHMYVMPHAPGQTPELLRTNMLAAVGYGTRHIDSFWVGPEERFTENYVAWNRMEQFQTLHEAIYDSAEAESLAAGGQVRPARVAVVIGRATDFNESRVMVDKSADPLASRCRNAPAQLNQILCRKDQQMLYLALRHAQHAVDLITEHDIVARNELANYDVVYFAGEWIDSSAVARLDEWVRAGGVLYATAGVGRFDEFNRPNPSMLKLLGLKGEETTKNTVVIRTLLELPLLPPIDTMTFGDQKLPAVGMKQKLTTDGAKAIATWSDGSVAATVHELGRGKAFAIGTLAGNTYMKTALRVQPWARGGKKTVYHPVDFDPTASRLVRLGVEARDVVRAAECSTAGVEAAVIDHSRGTLVTLLNWTNSAVGELQVKVRVPSKPTKVRSVRLQKELPVQYENGVATIALELKDADYVMLLK
jgi:hypothetical protein